MSNPKIIQEKELELADQDLHEFLARDVERWISENKAAYGNKVSKEMLYSYLAEKLEITPRQLKRYLDGATEISIKKAIALCKEIGLKGMFEYANYQLGLDTCETPSIHPSECDTYDAAEELIKNVKAFSNQAVVLSNSLNEKPSMGMLQKIRVASMEARKQILACERLYYEMLKQKALSEHRQREDQRVKRVEKSREALRRAGQQGLFANLESNEKEKNRR